MDKFIGKWKMIPRNAQSANPVSHKNNTCTIRRLRHDAFMIQSEWETQDHKNKFRGFTVYTDGVPREDIESNLKYVTKFKGGNVMTTSKMEDGLVKSMQIREVLDTGELKVTTIRVNPGGEQTKQVVYYQKVDSVS